MLLERILRADWPAFIRGDFDCSYDAIMKQAEQRQLDYLFKLKQSRYLKKN